MLPQRFWIRLNQVYQWCLTPLAFILFIGLLLSLMQGKKAGFSLILGGVLCLLPNSFFVFYLFKEPWARAALRIMRRMFVGELFKLLFIATGFVLMLRIFDLAMIPLLLGVVIAQVGLWITLTFAMLK